MTSSEINNISSELEKQLLSQATPATREESLVRFASRLARIGGWRVDLPNTVTLSDEVRDIFGVDEGEMLNLTQALDFCSPEWRARSETALSACAQEGTPYDHEFLLNTARGEQLWVRSMGQPVRDKTGAIVAVQGALQDITEKKEAQRAVMQSEQRFRTLADSMPWIVWTADPDGTVDYFNTATYDFAGPVDPENLSAAWLSFIHPDDAAAAWDTWERGVREGRQYQVELRIRRQDGSHRWHLNRGVPIRDEVGTIVKWYGAATDIHDRHLSEEANKRLAAQLSATLESVTDAFFILDNDWVFRYMNGESERLLQKSRSELLGQSIWEAFPEAMGTLFETEYRRAVAERCPVQFESYYAPLDLWFQVRGYPSDEGLAVYYTDVSSEKKARAERETLEAQLMHSQKMEAVGRLAGGVAHDFNNMLSVISCHTEILLHGVEPGSEMYSDLDAIRAAASRSAELTKQLLAFARKQTVAPQMLDVNHTLSGMITMLERLLGEDVQLVFRPGSRLRAVRIDPAQLDQVIANLAINARDAIATVGTIVVETATVDLDAARCASRPGLVPGSYVRISVADDGCGMDEQVLSQLFEPFFTTKSQGTGTGLGLAMCYGIVHQNDGHIEVTSQPGAGSRFDIYLPGHFAAAAAVETLAQGAESAISGETILLVEDEPALLKLCRRRLQQLGYNVLASGNPVEAIELARTYEGTIHLLLTDVVMPQLSGEDVRRTIEATRPDMKCLFMSGYTAEVIGRRGVLDEGVRFLAKPFSLEDLGSKVRQALE